MIYISVLIGILSALLGYALAYWVDTNIAGSMAVMSGVLFFLVLIFAPERGLLAKAIVKKWTKWDFVASTLIVHLLQAEESNAADTEMIVSHMQDHMDWSIEYTSEVIAQCIQEELINKEGLHLELTP